MSKERLEEIQRDVNYAYKRDGSINTKAVTMHIEHYEYLYEQAERVEAIIKHRNDILKANEYLNEQNKRYKQALEEILKINEKHEWNLYGLAYAMAERALLNEAPEQENDK